jgi:uncharacterized protein YacL
MHSLLFQSGVVLPDALVVIISGAIMFLATEGLKAVGAWLKIDLSGFAAGLTAIIVGLVVATLNGWLAMVPIQFAPFVNEVLTLLVLLLSGLGFYRVNKAHLK